jgi:plastocyanin
VSNRATKKDYQERLKGRSQQSLKCPYSSTQISMTTTKKNNNSAFYVGSVIAAAAILMAAGVTGSALLTPHQAIASIDNTIEEEERVSVGGILNGNLTISVNQFSPAAVEIQSGESVTFYAPENSTEVHNVIFDMTNGSTISGLELPFILPQGTDPEQLELAPPFNFGESIIQEQQPDGSQAIITLNKGAYYPTVADQENNTRYLIDVEEHEQLIEEARQQGFFEPQNLSANYTMNGTEAIVSSGIILDVGGFEALFEEEEGEEANMTAATDATDSNATADAATTPIPPAEIGQENTTATATEEGGEEEFPPLPYPILDSFTATFEEPGTYEYFCAFHPGMYGIVTVAGEEGEEAGEEGEVSAENLTTTTTTTTTTAMTNATDSNATTVVTTTPLPAAEIGQENTTTPATAIEEEQQEQQQTTAIPAPLLE